MNARVLTVGHSNHAPENFVQLLQDHAVEVVVDIRSQPISRHAPHFNRDQLPHLLSDSGISYLFLGRELGGRPGKPEMYDEHGHVRYDLVAGSEEFRQGLTRLEKGVGNYTVAIMCAEEDPRSCHRRLLVGRVLKDHNIGVDHIRGDGRVESEEELEAEERLSAGDQLDLFGTEDARKWRSTRSVLPVGARRASSKP